MGFLRDFFIFLRDLTGAFGFLEFSGILEGFYGIFLHFSGFYKTREGFHWDFEEFHVFDGFLRDPPCISWDSQQIFMGFYGILNRSHKVFEGFSIDFMGFFTDPFGSHWIV